MTNLILSKSEENYLKSIYNLSDSGSKLVTTNSISKILNIEPASVTDMIKKFTILSLLFLISCAQPQTQLPEYVHQ